MKNKNYTYAKDCGLRPIIEIIGAAIILALVTIAFFWQIVFTDNTWMPAGGGDLVPFIYPNYHFAAQTLQHGIIPLWNPHLYSGIPFAADSQSGLFYPVNLLVFLFHPNLTVETLEYMAIFHFWLAGWGMYIFLRGMNPNLSIHPLAAMAGAIAFEFSDMFIVHFGNLNMISVAAWLPLIMLTFQKSIAYKQSKFAIASGILLAIATLASHIQITLFILLALGLYTLFAIYTDWQGIKGIAHTILQNAKYLLITLIVMVGLSALWLIPTIEMSQYSSRAELPYTESAAYSLHPAQLIGLLVPNYFGRDPALHWGPWERVETGYIGILTLLLAITAPALRRTHQVKFMLFLAGISFILALGDNAILHGWLSLSPGFGQFRAPARYILLMDFALATLASISLQCLMQGIQQKAYRLFSSMLKTLTWLLGSVTIISLPLAYHALLTMQDRHPDIFHRAEVATMGVTTFAMLVAVSLTILHLARMGYLHGHRLAISVIIVISLDLFSLGAYVDVGHHDPTGGYKHSEANAFLHENVGINRLEVTTDIWHLWQPNSALLYGMHDAWGLYNPFTLSDMNRYWQHVGERRSGMYNFLGIKYVIASKAGAPADGDIVTVFDQDPTINIYLNRSAVSRITFVQQAIMVNDHEQAWQVIKLSDFDPMTTVVLEKETSEAQGVQFFENVEPLADAKIVLLKYDLHTVELSLTNHADGYLVLSDSYYPGWQATVDGQNMPIYRANYAFRAVPVAAGEHVVTFMFRPLSWRIGLVISVMTAFVIICILIWLRQLFYRRSEHAKIPLW